MEDSLRPTPGEAARHPGWRGALQAAPHLVLYPLAWLVLLMVGLGLGHLFEVADSLEPDDLDHRAWSWVVSHRDAYPRATGLFRAASHLGDSETATPLVILAVVSLAILGRRPGTGIGRYEWLFFLGTMLGSWLLGVGLKAHFERERPLDLHRLVSEDSYSFPSGHALNSATFCAISALTFRRAARGWAGKPAVRYTVLGLAGVLPLVIGASRVWLAVHYVSDVAGGLILGLAWVLTAVAVHERWLKRLAQLAWAR